MKKNRKDALDTGIVAILSAWILLVSIICTTLVVIEIKAAGPTDAGAMYSSTTPQIVHEGIHAQVLFDHEIYNTGNIDFDGYCFTPHDSGVYMVTLQNMYIQSVAGFEYEVDIGSAWVYIDDFRGNTWNKEVQIVRLDLPNHGNAFSLSGMQYMVAGERVCALAGQMGKQGATRRLSEGAKFGIERIR